jgi:guanylate kinase
MAGRLFIVSACSGAGKSTVVAEVINRLEKYYNIARLITYTTKIPRSNEINGKDYNFISHEEFEIRIKNGFFLEWSTYYGNYYGSPSYLIKDLELGKSYILITDLAGARSIAPKIKDSILIWLYVQNLEQIKERLLIRNTENFEQIQKRLLLAHKEIEEQATLNIFNYSILNENFETAVSELEMIVDLILKKHKKLR